MNGHVFECFQEGTKQGQFTKTVEALGEYIAKNVKNPGDMMCLTSSEMETPCVTKPKPLSKEERDDELEVALWKEKVSAYSKRTDVIEQNMKAIFAVIWGQCSESMKDKIRSNDKHKIKLTQGDCIWLLTEIKGIMLRFEGQRFLHLSLDDASRNLIMFRQNPEMSLTTFKTEFENLVDVFEHYGGTIGTYPSLVSMVSARITDTLEREKSSRNQHVAIMFLNRSDRRRYGTLWADLENQFARGNNQYPTDLTEAYSLLVNYKPPFPIRAKDSDKQIIVPKTSNDSVYSEMTGTTLLGSTEPVPGTDGVLHRGITCFACTNKGHYAPECPKATATGTQHLQVNTPTSNASPPRTHDTDLSYGYTFTQPPESIPRTWILLDSQSTVCVFNNSNLLQNIRKSPHPLRVATNGGTQISTLIGDLKNFGTVWYNPNSLANILSLAEVRRRCRCTMDTATNPAIHVHKANGTIMTFHEHENGLYIHDIVSQYKNKTNSDNIINYSFISTVAENKQLFSRREIEGADLARVLHRRIGRPSQKDFLHILDHCLIRNCPVTTADAKRAVFIYGDDIGSLKGKSTRTPPKHTPTLEAIPLPDTILEHHRNVTLCVDIFYVNQILFLHSISRKLKVRTVNYITSRHKPNILKEILEIIELYRHRGFIVTNIHGDIEFECIIRDIPTVNFEITPNDAHVPEVERSIRTIKERVRADINDMPYTRFPKIMIVELVRRAVKCLNQFPAFDGISDTISPFTMMTGKPNPDYTQITLDFGSYVQVFEDNNPTNSTHSRCTGAIALNPTGNISGDHYFMSLNTGRRLSRRQWTVIPITNEVISIVNAIGRTDGQCDTSEGSPIFEWSPNIIIDDTSDHDPDHQEFTEEEDATYQHATTNPNEHATQPIDDESEIDGDENVLPEDINDDDSIDETDYNSTVENDDVILNEAHDDTTVDENNNVIPDDTHNQQSVDPTNNHTDNEDPENPIPRYNLRPDRTRDYSHRFDAYQLLSHNTEDMHHYVVGYIMTQMTAQVGIKKHGDKAVEALLAEFCQLDDKSVFQPREASELTSKQKYGALRAINLIKEKRCGKLKGRTCADGRSQKGLYDKQQTTSPTVSTDALMVSLMIDSLEQRDVATADVTGAYLNADMDEFVLIKLSGDATDIMCTANNEYKNFVTTENGKKVLYLQLLKALYGCVRSALLWYELFVSTLEEMGFILNPYDLCVANKTINGKQCTIVWYVDDNKISHVDPNVVTEILLQIEKKFGKMTTTRGKEHVFLGMKINFQNNQTVRINMEQYINEAIIDFQEDVSIGVTTPANKNLFELNVDAPRLRKDKSDLFHSIVAKLLYVAKRGRPDILLAIAFLCTRVSCSTTEDWGKLKRLLQYLNRTIAEYATIGADSLSKIRTWVDASYGVHSDLKSHTGGTISLGRGVVMSKSSKQKLNTKSSTEAEVVGASDYLPNTIWLKYFLEAQGYVVTDSIFAQDNKSAILLEKNGRKSCGQKSRHIDIRFFFTKDRIENGNITVEYCPTEQMLADFLTKPLQGTLFKRFKNILMGHVHIRTLYQIQTPQASSTIPEERVENSITSCLADNAKLSVPLFTVLTEEPQNMVLIQNSDMKGNSENTDGWTEVRKRTRKVRFVDTVPKQRIRIRT
jgi:Reverse transcriptase (RNA-dependent DNA polymerase)